MSRRMAQSDDCGIVGQTDRYDVLDLSSDGLVDIELSDDFRVSDDIARTHWRTLLGDGCPP